MNRRSLFWVIFTLTLILDQAVKAHARSFLGAEHHSTVLIPHVLNYTLIYNRGIAFGFLSGLGVFLAPVAVLIAALAALYSLRHPKEGVMTHIAMGLLASGALGNLYDRLVLKQVTDMFEIRLFDFPVFNIADSCITIAAAILIVKWAREAVVPQPEPACEPAPEVGPTTQESERPAPTETLSVRGESSFCASDEAGG